MDGRMVPGVALVASAANSALRGTLMALISSVHPPRWGWPHLSAALSSVGCAAAAGSKLRGHALVGVLTSAASLLLVRHLHGHGADAAPVPLVTPISASQIK